MKTQLFFLLLFFCNILFAQEKVPENYISLKNPLFKSLEEYKLNSSRTPKVSSFKIDANKVILTLDFFSKHNVFYKGLSYNNICNFVTEKCRINKFEIEEIDFKNRAPVAIALVLDHSGSMGSDNAYKLQQSVIDFIKRKKKEDFIVLIKFDHKVLTIEESDDQETLIQSLKKYGIKKYGGSTALNDGLMTGVKRLSEIKSNKYSEKIIMTFTDGRENSSSLKDTSKILSLGIVTK